MSDKQERRSAHRVDCFDHSLLDDCIEHSLVVDVSDTGAGLLLHKEKGFFDDETRESNHKPSDNVHLIIFHPERSLEKGLRIDAEICWVDEDYSSDHRKIGVRFTGTDEAQTGYIKQLTEWLSMEGHYFFHCELNKC